MSDDYESLVQQYVEAWNGVTPAHQWKRIDDPRVEPTRVVTKGLFTGRERTEVRRKTLRVNPGQHAAYRALTDCVEIVERLNLPVDSPIPAQVDAARRRFADIVETRPGRGLSTLDSWDSVEHGQALRLAAEVRAVVHFAERREQVLHAIDSDSLARTAAALKADLDAARHIVLADPLDRALHAAEQPRHDHT